MSRINCKKNNKKKLFSQINISLVMSLANATKQAGMLNIHVSFVQTHSAGTLKRVIHIFFLNLKKNIYIIGGIGEQVDGL